MAGVIFVDCFNTIILRKTSSNEVIYNFTQKLGLKYEIEPSILYKYFIKCKNNLAVKNKIKTGESEYSLEDEKNGLAINFYNVLKSKFNVQQKEFLTDVFKFYKDAELESFELNKEVVDKLTVYKKEGKKIYLISDFYCGKQFFTFWFEKLNILNLFDDIFVSCDYNLSKRNNGKLYKKVLNLLNINKKDVLMIGDNKKADYKNAKRRGIKSYKINTKILKDNKNFKKLVKYGNQFVNLEKLFNDGDEFNFSNFAFPLYLFEKRLYNELIEKDVKDIFFFAREGKFLKKLFDIYCEKNGYKKINSHYLMASRNSMFLASLKPLDEEDFYYCLRDVLFLTIKKFLKTLNFDDEIINKIQNELGINICKKYHKLGKSKDFKNLLNNSTFINEYNKKREQNSKALEAYLKTFNTDISKQMFVVDVGWSGTIQDLLTKFLSTKYNTKIYGYYIGARDKTAKDMACKTGLLYSPKTKKYRGHKFFHHNMAYYEQILRADHNRVDGYIIKDGIGSYILDTKIDDEKNYKMLIKHMQEKIANKFEKICELDVYKNYSLFEDYVIRANYKMITHPTKKDIEWLFSCEDSHFDNFIIVGYNFQLINHTLRKIIYKIGNSLFKIKYGLTAKKISFKRAIKNCNKLGAGA